MPASSAHRLDAVGALSADREPDALLAARQAFFSKSPAPSPRAPHDRPCTGELERLLEIEYGERQVLALPLVSDPLSRDDADLALLRRSCRLRIPLTPEKLLGHASGDPRTLTVLAEMWPETVRRHGADHAEKVLRASLLDERCEAARLAFLLDCAESARLSPLSAAEAVRLAPYDDRCARHALWRYLHHVRDGRAHLPAAHTATDPYERLLLAPPGRLTEDRWPQAGLVVAQSMLQGGLDTPGQGSSGGMSVLLGGLGDALARTERIASVLTLVAAGRDELGRRQTLLRRRLADHWVLSLPVDAPTSPAPDEWPAHRAAVRWWATRLLGSLPRPVDVLHVRFADDGGLALAQAAARIGSGLCFTATPDPHRTVVRAYATAPPQDPGRRQRLRADLHRVFCADQLVERADTVVGIPGRCGTEKLLHCFPVLAERYGPAGPPAPPEGLVPYVAVSDEEARRRKMLADLYAGGDRPDALAPADRSLPLLLCVGRLHAVKQQDLLLRTWLSTQLWRTTALVLIGGGTERPTAEEQRMRAVLGSMLVGQEKASRRLALLPALGNDEVRRLEHALGDPGADIAAWYVCPSAKEEFGIAVLEAMEAGLPAAGPRNGGVAHYLRDGVNGTLLDTSSAAGLARGLRRLVAVPASRRRAMGDAARDTVVRSYRVSDMAKTLAHEYLALARPSEAPDVTPV
ncbi:hypothetical protein GCM10010329_79450 [Streptomyces spiroverticillatus]|uniref:Glycosyl transferase family 1 domain-containing protein n=1 Tax=Streptomyces finlayi TaxID=67296 RepID=A0A918X8A3_9ACTN|nr:glycosyltransferase family 4 protein [Streptomyces finlayi]GHA44846.1 hypothetical protein GCM10010329_79450 [Streptomyces spiroverticillatus]GHD18043.1 hypothetical protein GCM10010334_80430 [Streptomyces finlayi]